MAVMAGSRHDALVCTKIDWLQQTHQWPSLVAIGKVSQ
jgi:hypothetical protein